MSIWYFFKYGQLPIAYKNFKKKDNNYKHNLSECFNDKHLNDQLKMQIKMRLKISQDASKWVLCLPFYFITFTFAHTRVWKKKKKLFMI